MPESIPQHDPLISAGARTPFAKVGTALESVPAHELMRIVLQEALERAGIRPADVDEVIVGNVAQPAEATNLARVASLLAGIPRHVPAFTVNRNCGSALQAIADELNEQGHTTRRGKPWNRMQVSRVLKRAG